MFHVTNVSSIHRIAIRRAEIAHALSLDDESEITAAIEDVSHVVYSAWLFFREVDRLASEAKQRQALQRLLRAPTLMLALLNSEDARVANRIASHLPKRVELPKGSEPSPNQIKTAIAAAVATLGSKKKRPVTRYGEFGATPVRPWTRRHLGQPYGPAADAAIRLLEKKEYGPFFDFVELVLSMLPVRFRSMKIKGNLKNPRSLGTMACAKYRLATESGDPRQLVGRSATRNC
jgi:hypothetical protein